MTNVRQTAAQRIRKSPAKFIKNKNIPSFTKVLTQPRQQEVYNFNQSQDKLTYLTNVCSDTMDPISMDDFSELSPNDLNNVVAIGSGPKKHCYLLDNIYNHIKVNTEHKHEIKDPMNPSHILSDEEIETIYALKSQSDPNFKRPIKETKKPAELSPLDIDLIRQIEGDNFEDVIERQRQLMNNQQQRVLPVLRDIHGQNNNRFIRPVQPVQPVQEEEKIENRNRFRFVQPVQPVQPVQEEEIENRNRFRFVQAVPHNVRGGDYERINPNNDQEIPFKVSKKIKINSLGVKEDNMVNPNIIKNELPKINNFIAKAETIKKEYPIISEQSIDIKQPIISQPNILIKRPIYSKELFQQSNNKGKHISYINYFIIILFLLSIGYSLFKN